MASDTLDTNTAVAYAISHTFERILGHSKITYLSSDFD